MLQLPHVSKLLWATLLPLLSIATAQAQPAPQANASTSDNQPTASFSFQGAFTPPGEGRPKKTKGAGARDGQRCSPDGPEIRAVMPPGNYGLTLQARPKVVIDFAGEVVPEVLLAFKNEAGTTVERVTIDIASTPYFVSGSALYRLGLPEQSTALQVGKNYQWSLLVACDGTINPSHPIFSGWVQRVIYPPELKARLLEKPAAEQIHWFANHGYWYDAIETLSQGLEDEIMEPQLTPVWEEVLTLINAR